MFREGIGVGVVSCGWLVEGVGCVVVYGCGVLGFVGMLDLGCLSVGECMG